MKDRSIHTQHHLNCQEESDPSPTFDFVRLSFWESQIYRKYYTESKPLVNNFETY